MLAELKLAPHDWPSVLPVITSALNEAPLARLGYNPEGLARSPLEVMTGIKPRRDILRVLPQDMNPLHAKTMEHAGAIQVLKIQELHVAMDKMHKAVASSVNLRRPRSVNLHNQATNIITPSFSVGDFVVVRCAMDRGQKLCFKWYGPCRVTAIHGPLVYSITSLVSKKAEPVHCARLRQYDDSLLGSEVSKDMLDIAERTETRYEIVDAIVDIGEASDGLFFQVQWEGVHDKRDGTWRPIAELYAEIPDVVDSILSSSPKKKNVNKAKSQLHLST